MLRIAQVVEFLILTVLLALFLASCQGQTIDPKLQAELLVTSKRATAAASKVKPTATPSPQEEDSDHDEKLTCEQARSQDEFEIKNLTDANQILSRALAGYEWEINDLRATLDRVLAAKTAQEAFLARRTSNDPEPSE